MENDTSDEGLNIVLKSMNRHTGSYDNTQYERLMLGEYRTTARVFKDNQRD